MQYDILRSDSDCFLRFDDKDIEYFKYQIFPVPYMLVILYNNELEGIVVNVVQICQYYTKRILVVAGKISHDINRELCLLLNKGKC